MTRVLMPVIAAQVWGCCAFSSPRCAMPPSDHYDGEVFRNQRDVSTASVGQLAYWMTHRNPGPWREWTETAPGARPPRRVGIGEIRVTFVNHATMLLQMDGMNILTDPVWSYRVGPMSWAGQARKRAPGIRWEDLPSIDVVLVSHNHYDHMDIPTLKALFERDHPTMVSGLGNKLMLASEDIDSGVELDWWEWVDVHPMMRVTAVPAQHFSMRGLCDKDQTLWVGFVIQGRSGPVYFAGDTGFGPHFGEIRKAFGPMRLAFLPIAPSIPRYVMEPVHISAEEAVVAHKILGAKTSVAMHFGTFQQADDPQDAAPQWLGEAMRKHGVAADAFWVLGFGEGRRAQ